MKIPANSASEFPVRRLVVAKHLVSVGRHQTFERISDEHEREVIVQPVSDLWRREGA